MERIKRYLRSAAGYQAVCAKWLVLAALVGCVVGPLGGAFGLALNWANATRGAHPWLLYLLPVAGLVIVFLYHALTRMAAALRTKSSYLCGSTSR